MSRQRSHRRFYKSVSVPAGEYLLVKRWVDSGEAPYVSVDEAYRDAIRNILYGRWPEKIKG
ncbi:MAG: hypothetical protein ABIJ47_06940 [Candidatus Bathyarchaeota archaeon]